VTLALEAGGDGVVRNEAQSRAVLKESLLMAMCIRDMMQGNAKLAENSP
jgi:hypothetical protein